MGIRLKKEQPRKDRTDTPIERYDDVIKWKHFSRYWSFVREITGDRTKVSDAKHLFFLWSAHE